MKKGLVLVMTLIMTLSLLACGGTGDGDSSKLIKEDNQGHPYIADKKMGSIIEKHELTADNWRDYIKLVTYEYTEKTVDAFGDITSEIICTETMIGLEKDRYYCFDSNAAVKLKNKTTGNEAEVELPYLISDPYEVKRIGNLDDYDLVKIQGNVYYLDLPEEVFVNPDNDPRFVRWYHESGGFNFVNIHSKYVDYDGEYLEEYLK